MNLADPLIQINPSDSRIEMNTRNRQNYVETHAQQNSTCLEEVRIKFSKVSPKRIRATMPVIRGSSKQKSYLCAEEFRQYVH